MRRRTGGIAIVLAFGLVAGLSLRQLWYLLDSRVPSRETAPSFAADERLARPGAIKWRVDVGLWADQTPPGLGADDTVYVSGERYLHAIAKDGRVRWKVNASGIAISRDGRLYTRRWPKALVALNDDGSERWEVPTDIGWDSSLGGLAADDDGTILVALGSRIYRIDAEGAVRLTADVRPHMVSGPAMPGPEHTIYVTTMDRGGDDRVRAIGSDGRERWNVRAHVIRPPAVTFDGTFYTAWTELFRISPAGRIDWHRDLRGVAETPVARDDGTVFIAAGSDLLAFDAGGRLLWTFGAASTIHGPAFGADGTIFIAGESAYALEPTGRERWQVALSDRDDAQFPPLVASDGTLIVQTSRNVYAIAPR